MAVRESDCYKCKHRGDLVYDAHSKCEHPAIVGGIGLLHLAGVIKIKMKGGEPLVDINKHGKKNGWANWPVNFDPIWITKCHLFEKAISDSVSGVVSGASPRNDQP